MSIPQYLMGQVGQIDFSPAENALTRMLKQQQMNREFQLQQQRMGMDQERLGFERQRLDQEMQMNPLRLGLEQARLAQARDELGFNRERFPLQLATERERLAATRDEMGFKRQMQPLELEQRRAEIDLKRKALEAAKRGTVKEGEALWVEDPTQPGRIRFIEPPQGAAKLNPTQAKELQEADDFVLQTQNAIDQLRKARLLNQDSYDGWLASQRADVYANVTKPDPKDPKAVKGRTTAVNTLDLENVVTNQALQSLRSIFGGNPTEGERKILLSVAGSVNQPRDVRERIFAEAERLAERRLAVNQQKAYGIRQGTYYRPGGQPPALIPGQPPAERVNSGPGIPVAPQQAAPPAQPQVPLPKERRAYPQPPAPAVEELMRSPSPQMKAFFDEEFGPGSADAVLKGRR